MGKIKTTEEFIAKSKEIYGERYDYSNTNYISNKEKVSLICPDHGEFQQPVNYHLEGRECIRCAASKRALKKRKGYEKFKDEANIVHNFSYIYNDKNYKDNKTKIKVTCPNHSASVSLHSVATNPS